MLTALCVALTGALADDMLDVSTHLVRQAFEPLNPSTYDVSQSEYSMNWFAALVVHDMAYELADEGFDADSIKYIYFYGYHIDILSRTPIPSLYIRTASGDWDIGVYWDDMIVTRYGVLSDEQYRKNIAEGMASGEWKSVSSLDTSTVRDMINDPDILAARPAAPAENTELFRKADGTPTLSNGWIYFFNNHKFSFINVKGRMLTGDWDRLYGFSSKTGTAIVYRGKVGTFHSPKIGEGFFGLIDEEGNEVLPVSYKNIERADSEVLMLTSYDGSMQLYDILSGTFIVPEDNNISYVGKGQDGIFRAYRGRLQDGNPSYDGSLGKWGMIDKYGKTVVPFEYDTLGYISYGHAVVSKNGQFGVVDTHGKLCIPMNWKKFTLCEKGAIADSNKVLDYEGNLILTIPDDPYMLYFDNGYYKAVYIGSDSGDRIFDTKGNEIDVGKWYGVTMVNEELAIVCKKATSSSLPEYGVYNYRTKQIVLPLEYEKIGPLSDGLRLFVKDHKYGYMDANFDIVIPAMYIEAGDFDNGYAVAQNNSGWHVIDVKGNMIF